MVNIVDEIKLDLDTKYLYGAGTMAEAILLYFEKEGIGVDAVIVDDAYYKSNMKMRNGLDILPISVLADKKSKSVIAGMADYKHIKEMCKGYGVDKVYYFSAVVYGRLGMYLSEEYIKKHL